jgi:hypothetical protein
MINFVKKVEVGVAEQWEREKKQKKAKLRCVHKGM